MRHTTSHGYADLTLSAYLASFAAGRRVLWVGPASDDATGPLAAQAARVEVVQAIDDVPDGAFDIAVVPDVGALAGPLDGEMDRLRRIVGPEGALVVGWPAAAEASERQAAIDLLEQRFASVRVVGQAPFEGYALAEVGAVPSDVLIDGSLVERGGEAPQRLLAVCVAGDSSIDPYAVIQCPPVSGSVSVDLAEASDGDGGDGEHARLEGALADRARKVRDLEREVERRGALVRDLVEELKAAGSGATAAVAASEVGGEAGGDAALQRALEAEAARAEALYRIDELSARVAELDAEARSLREANLEGTVRGLQSRAAELEEVHAVAEGRLELARLDLEAAARRERLLEQQLAELREQFELELVRSRGVDSADRHRSERLQEQLEELGAEDAGLRDRLSERERALEEVHLAAEEANRQSDVQELRRRQDELVARLQFDLAEEEKRSRDREVHVARLREENEQLRTAVVDASGAAEERNALQQTVDRLQRAIVRGHDAMREVRGILLDLPPAERGRPKSEITAAGIESPIAGGESSQEDLHARLKALQERAARLQEQLEHERQARKVEAERTPSSPGFDIQAEVRKAHALAGEREAEVEVLRGKLTSQERELKVLRDACTEARQQLDDLLSSATESGDPATAERIGELLRLFGRV